MKERKSEQNCTKYLPSQRSNQIRITNYSEMPLNDFLVFIAFQIVGNSNLITSLTREVLGTVLFTLAFFHCQ